MIFNLFSTEKRSSFTQSTPQSFAQLLGFDGYGSGVEGISVTTETALSVPAVAAAVNVISRTIADLPLQVFKVSKDDSRTEVKGGVASILGEVVNPEMTSYEWREYTVNQILTGGRGISYIERSPKGAVQNIWPLDPGCVIIERRAGRKVYKYNEKPSDNINPKTYEASEILDVPFMLKADMLNHRGPIAMNRDVISLAIAATRYGARFFDNGGVPPFVISGNFQSPAAIARAGDDLEKAVKKAIKEDRQALALPSGIELKTIGVDPEKSQLIETQRYLIEQIARIYSVPPTFLQDLTHGTYSNTEQQDLHFVKHTISHWIEKIEQEINLKVFGRNSRTRYAKFDLDGLLRGDFSTRMKGYRDAISTGLLTPDEARKIENRPNVNGGDRAYIQGAMVPLERAGEAPTPVVQGEENET